jgi:hypothetical protein
MKKVTSAGMMDALFKKAESQSLSLTVGKAG